MSLFNRKKDETKPCCCSGSESSAEKAEGNVQSIKVLGAGCKASTAQCQCLLSL